VVYGDKVIDLRNASWMDWQKIEPHGAKARALNYIANGETGIITGEFRSRNYHNKSKPDVEIAFSTQPGYSYVFRQNDLGEDAVIALNSLMQSQYIKPREVVSRSCLLFFRRRSQS
jgi:hypothetical protein